MELSKNYEPQLVEEKWNLHWKQKKYFNSLPDDRPSFTVVIPPPNVTGVLHMGHTLNETVQDILVRRARMMGFNACWVPGSDHASIATEAKVVHMLETEKGISKNNLTREEFLKYAYEWKEKYGGIIYHQIDKLGCSVDWNRVSFTMDKDYYASVIKIFVTLYNKGLIYRGARMINWDPVAKTALSDEEVEYKEVQSKLYYVQYKLDGQDGFITIATTRPETILGDTAICAHPADERYKHLKGAFALVPLINRRIPIIFDEYVDPEFGTGCLKITPAHDINDYNIGLKYNLPIIDTLNDDGTLSEAAQLYIGKDRFDVRSLIAADLQASGNLVKTEDIINKNGLSQRTHAVVEPRISTQWFLNMKNLAQPALKAVVEGDITIHPGDKFLATYRYWLENVKDWNISRQLWWGQRIPAWYDEAGNVYVGETLEQVQQQAPPGTILKQDEDVLDTWFSSWLWPIEVFKGISNPGNADINYYYPTSVLVTGQDIIFFWVARMIMAGMEFMHQKPFKDVYFTGMVRDKQGRKMSKQLGNSPDLLKLIDVYGADAVRFGIMIASPAGNDLLFDDSSCEQGKLFNNKLWNALKLVKIWEQRQSHEVGTGVDSYAVTWFRARLNQAKTDIEKLFAEFKLSEALKLLYSLVWSDFCSWYLEWAKPGFEEPISTNTYKATVSFFEELMHLLHPYMPFVTEEIFHQLKEQPVDLTILQYSAPPKGGANVETLRNGQLLQEVITTIRDARVNAGLKPKDTITLHISSPEANRFAQFETILARQVNATIVYTTTPVAGTIQVVHHVHKFYIETTVALNTGAQREQLEKELDYYKGFLVSVEKKLSNQRFVQNAKPEVVAAEQKKRSDAQEKIKTLEESLSSIG